MTNGSLMKVKNIAECSTICNTFDLHLVIISIENQFLRVAVLHRVYCINEIRVLKILYITVAQLVECRTHDFEVADSNPTGDAVL